MFMWMNGDRVKISPTHYGSGLQNRLGTVLRTSPSGLVEVELDSYYLAGIGIVAFKEADLLPTVKKRRR
jgi:translation initiation factor IF-1